MKWILVAVIILIALVGVCALVGALLPKGHVASRTAKYRESPEALWQSITDYTGSPSWRTELKEVVELPERNGHPVWREVNRQGQGMALETVESDPPRRLVRKIADPDLPFGGTWTYEIVPSDGGSRLTITERGEVYNPIFRFVSRFIFGHTTTIDRYLKALGNKFGENVGISG